MIADEEANKKLTPAVMEWFLGGRKLNISLVFLIHNPTSKYIKLQDKMQHISLSRKFLTKENFNKKYQSIRLMPSLKISPNFKKII